MAAQKAEKVFKMLSIESMHRRSTYMIQETLVNDFGPIIELFLDDVPDCHVLSCLRYNLIDGNRLPFHGPTISSI
jgi:hypothetical protein